VSEVRERPPPILNTSMAGPLGGDDGDPGVPTINAKNIDDRPPGRLCQRSESVHHQRKKCRRRPPRRWCRRSESAHHQHKKCQRWAPWEAMTEIQEHPPSTQKMSMAGLLRGGDGDPGASTINTKNIDGRPPNPIGGSGLHPGSERCVLNLHGYDRQKVILLTGLTFPATGPVMADDPSSAYRAWIIQCDTI
jgi:hypothetical protein